jgi:hypothetical protein
VERRVLKLKEKKILTGMVLSTRPLEYESSSHVVLLYARGFNEIFRNELVRFATEHPHCTYFIECFGGWDFELGVEVENYSQLVRFREHIGERFGSYLSTLKTLTRFQVLKYSSFPLAAPPIKGNGRF